MSIFGHNPSDEFINEIRQHRSFIFNRETQGAKELELLKELDKLDKDIINLLTSIRDEYGAQQANIAESLAIDQKGYARLNLQAYVSAIGKKRIDLLKDTKSNLERVLDIVLANRTPRHS